MSENDQIERMSHVNISSLFDLEDELDLTEPPAPALELPRPKPVELLQRWELRPVARWSESPLPEEMNI